MISSINRCINGRKYNVIALDINIIRKQDKNRGWCGNNKVGNGMIPTREGLGLLALVNHVVERTKNLSQGEVMACSDNKHVLRNIENDVKKESQSTV